MDILEFYGLKEDPFKLTPDPMYFFPSVSHDEALSSLNYVVQQKEGFCLITGEPGTGKTTVLNVFKENWKDKAEIALILSPRLSPEDFLLSVLEDFNVKTTISNKNELLKAFRDFLIEKSQIGKSVIIIVDEAQNLPDETLEELRLLSNLETEKEKLLQIILIGQPELEERLNGNKLRQLNQRITVRVRLNPLSTNEILEYINYRLIKAGKGFLRLDKELSSLIRKYSSGIPRIINILSSRAIMSAYLEESSIVTRKHVKYAIRHLKDSYAGKEISRRWRPIYALSAVMLFLFIGAVGYRFFIEQNNSSVNIIKNIKGSNAYQETTQVIKKDLQQSFNSFESGQDNKVLEEQEKYKKTAIVIVDSANLMSEPSLDSECVARASKGFALEIAGESSEKTGIKWHKVKIFDGIECWIEDKIVSIR